MKLNVVTLALVAAAALVFAQDVWGVPWTPMRVAGLALTIPSFVLFVLARMQLGRAFSVRAKATTLVTTGVYARIRNPIYVFGGLMLAGAMLWAGQPRLLPCFVVLVPLQVYRSRKEARVLEETFGAAYLEYRRKTWF